MFKKMLVLLAANLLCSATSFAYQYTFTDLGSLGGTTSIAHGINDKGQVVGYSYLSDNVTQHATLWSNGSVIDLGTLGGRLNYAYGINNIGQVAGFSNLNGDSSAHAFIYDASGMRDLGTLGGTDSRAYGINSSGQVVGTAYGNWEPHNGSFNYGFITGANGIGMNALQPYDITPLAINSSGHAAGYFTYYAHSNSNSPYNSPIITSQNGTSFIFF